MGAGSDSEEGLEENKSYSHSVRFTDGSDELKGKKQISDIKEELVEKDSDVVDSKYLSEEAACSSMDNKKIKRGTDLYYLPSTSSGVSAGSSVGLLQGDSELRNIDPYLFTFIEKDYKNYLKNRTDKGDPLTFEHYYNRLKGEQERSNRFPVFVKSEKETVSVKFSFVKGKQKVGRDKTLKDALLRKKGKGVIKKKSAKTSLHGISNRDQIAFREEGKTSGFSRTTEIWYGSVNDAAHLGTMDVKENSDDEFESEDIEEVLNEAVRIITSVFPYDKVPCRLEKQVLSVSGLLRTYNFHRTTNPADDADAFLRAREEIKESKLNDDFVIDDVGFGNDGFLEKIALLSKGEQLVFIVNGVHLFLIVIFLFDPDLVEKELVDISSDEYVTSQETSKSEFYSQLQKEKGSEKGSEDKFLIGVILDKRYQWLRVTRNTLVEGAFINLQTYELADSYKLSPKRDVYRDNEPACGVE